MTVEFFTNPMSRGRIVHWMLEEVGEPYETRWLPWGPRGHRSPEYLAINPMGKVPALRHDGKVVTEAPAIIMYLADVFAGAGLAPRSEEKADYYRWMFFAAGPLEQAQVAGGLGWVVPEERSGMVGFRPIAELADALEAHLSPRPFVCGDRFTAADVYVASHIAWGLQGKTIPARPSFASYLERTTARPAFRRSAAACDAKLAEDKSTS